MKTPENISKGAVTLSVENGLATITFFHPAHNSLPSRLLSDLVEAIENADNDPAAKVLLLQSEGEKTFCAGASFDELSSINNFETGKQFFMGFANVINACRKSKKIIICRVQGKAIGGGVGLAAAADYCFATAAAAVKLSELAVGIGPFVVGPAVERKMGLSAFSQMAIHATQWKSAHWAKEKGLFAEVFETINDLDDAIQTLVAQLVASSSQAQAALKEIFWQGTENWDELLAKRAAISGQLILADAAKEAIRKFKEGK